MLNFSNGVHCWSCWLEIVLDCLVLLYPMLSHVFSAVQYDIPNFLPAVSEHNHVPSAVVGEGPEDAGPGSEASGFRELDVYLVSGD